MTRPWMPLYVGDYLGDTSHLTTTEHGAYMLLIMHYWAKGRLPDDDVQLSRIVRMPINAWMEIRGTIQAFFSDGWRHKRVELELTEAARLSAAGRTGGTASGKVRRERSLANRSNDFSAKREALQPQPHPQKNPEPNGSAPADIRDRLFKIGLETLCRITGRTPDSGRSLIGMWLKRVQDEAIHVLAAIEDAERNRIANPVPWINQRLENLHAPLQFRSGQTPRRGSREDIRERTVLALDRLDEFARSESDANGRIDSGQTGPPLAGRIPKLGSA